MGVPCARVRDVLYKYEPVQQNIHIDMASLVNLALMSGILIEIRYVITVTIYIQSSVMLNKFNFDDILTCMHVIVVCMHR